MIAKEAITQNQMALLLYKVLLGEMSQAGNLQGSCRMEDRIGGGDEWNVDLAEAIAAHAINRDLEVSRIDQEFASLMNSKYVPANI